MIARVPEIRPLCSSGVEMLAPTLVLQAALPEPTSRAYRLPPEDPT